MCRLRYFLYMYVFGEQYFSIFTERRVTSYSILTILVFSFNIKFGDVICFSLIKVSPFLVSNVTKSEPHDSYRNNSYIKKCVV